MPTPDKSSHEVLKELDRQAENPPKIDGQPDEYIAAFSTAMAGHLRDSPETMTMLDSAVREKRESSPFPPTYVANFVLRLCQMTWMDEPDYPFSEEAKWRKKIDEFFNDPIERNLFSINMVIWNVGSDVETRAAGPKLVAHSLQPERATDQDKPFTVLNIGSARDHSLSVLAANIPFPHVGVDTHGYDEDLLDNKAAHLERAINELLGKKIELGDCYGVDIWPLQDERWSKFLRACRYYPAELNDPIKRQRYDELESIRDNDPRLHHAEADFGDIGGLPNKLNGWLEGIKKSDKYDMIVFSTCLYQNYPKERRKMIKNAIDRLAEGGKVVVQDFCSVEPVSDSLSHPADQLVFPNDWFVNAYTYGTFVYDPAEKDKGFRPFALWNNSRCEKIRPAQLLIDAALKT